MKRYLIPAIFFTIGLLLQVWLYFSWITFGLLSVSTILLSLLIFSISEMSTIPGKEDVVESSQENASETKEELKSEEIANEEESQTYIPPFFEDRDPIALAREIKKGESKALFCETVKQYSLPKRDPKISSLLYAFYDGIGFTECFWQKGALLVDSESNDLEWEEYEKDTIKELLPCLSRNKQKLYLPLSLNQNLFGLVCLTTKEKFSDSEIASHWESTLILSEKLLEKREYARALRDPKTSLFNKSHFYHTAKDKFYSQIRQTLVLLKFVKEKHSIEFAICLNEMIKKRGLNDSSLFQLEDSIVAGFIPNQNLDQFTYMMQSFVEELDELGYECELALGYSSPSEPNLKFDQWIKKAYISLENSILHNAA
ncbi:hypothetical protein [Leptospira idonii]|uniref:Uncharacterized protein n=1 Tax=Leptospira idonii TaxID=1193500 RepID=A0A4R9LXB8_9LEPT|nr:hypothetical protein [Leptospira idonii]TGN18910.1 hypothetical protein EHS15_10850 [Leptospira idonii]